MAKGKSISSKLKSKTSSVASNSSVSTASAGTVSLSSVEKEMEKYQKIMQEHISDATGYLQHVPGATKSGYDAWHSARKEYQKLQEIRSGLIDKETASFRKNYDPSPKTFVNSFGEATTRQITSNTYERAQKRLDKQVLRNMGY